MRSRKCSTSPVNCWGSCRKEKWLTWGLQQQPGIGDRAGHELGVLALDRLVVIGVDDPGRHRDASQLLGREVGLRLPHLADLVEKGFVLVWCRRQCRVFLFGARDIGVGHRAVGDVGHPARIGIGGKSKELAQPLGMMDRDVETDYPPVAPTDDRHLGELQEVHQADHVRGHQVVAVGPVIVRAAPVAAAVHDDDPILWASSGT
jgi:hypothetical protein